MAEEAVSPLCGEMLDNFNDTMYQCMWEINGARKSTDFLLGVHDTLKECWDKAKKGVDVLVDLQKLRKRMSVVSVPKEVADLDLFDGCFKEWNKENRCGIVLEAAHDLKEISMRDWEEAHADCVETAMKLSRVLKPRGKSISVLKDVVSNLQPQIQFFSKRQFEVVKELIEIYCPTNEDLYSEMCYEL